VWLSLIEWIVVPVGEEYAPDLILISAGFDAHRDDPLAGCALGADDFAEMARHVRDLGERTGAPVGAVLEGGYHPPALAEAVAETMAALAGDTPRASAAPDFLTERAASHIGHRWRL
jgi:acetoin utilization deacetylase AcuC-like enzyme